MWKIEVHNIMHRRLEVFNTEALYAEKNGNLLYPLQYCRLKGYFMTAVMF